MCLLEDLIQGHWLSRHPMYHAYDFISTNHAYLYTCTKLCIPPLVHWDYLISKVVKRINKTRYKFFKNNIYKKFVCRNWFPWVRKCSTNVSHPKNSIWRPFFKMAAVSTKYCIFLPWLFVKTEMFYLIFECVF